MSALEKHFNPKDAEERWYAYWLDRGYFRPSPSGQGSFSIVIPPPNITGSLHMGHALNSTLQDILARWKRMLGCETLWLPGTDHAGIATQNIVERDLAREKLDRNALGRDAFIKRVWQWKDEYGGRIIHQLKRLGASCDWSRERFTMDEGLSRAVREVFVRLYEEGLIYRDNRLINWCPRCLTALSDLEVEHEEIEGLLTYIKYPLTGGDGQIIVATTRPETMLGDTAVAVNPADERYKEFIDRTVALPLTNREIPVLADNAIDPAFGTGAVKVTPAHDFADEEIAKRQHPPLLSVKIIDERGRMTSDAGSRYEGLDRFQCRKQVIEDLKGEGLIEKEERYRHAVGHCYRCKTVIEPLATIQWYVKTAPLAEEALQAVHQGRIRIIPKSWENTYFSWMENIRDWCISRQIWWGHRIPAWYCGDCHEINVSRETPGQCMKCGSRKLTQDSDVLDTWFSSALWPFSTLGWPEYTQDLKTFYPTSVLVTAFDILFFWVARMTMMGLKFMKEVPFRDVYIHALVRDAKGEKMSKSKGNVIDPLTIIEKHGTDAFRFALAAFAAQGRDIRFSVERVEGYRYFVNKIWNATRFIMMHLETLSEQERDEIKKALEHFPDADTLRLNGPSLWILSRLASTADAVNEALGEYRFNDAASAMYQFLWHEYCDWYIEMAKYPIMEKTEDREGTIACLLSVLGTSLRMLHPLMPFVTEEIWQSLRDYLPDAPESIMTARYPQNLPRYKKAEEEISFVIDAVTGIRNIRGELNIPPSAEVRVLIKVFDSRTESVCTTHVPMIERIAKAKEITVGISIAKPRGSSTAVRDSCEIYIPLEGLLDVDEEVARLNKEKGKIQESISFLDGKLGSQDFLERAPREIVEKERSRYQELLQKRERLDSSIERLKNVGVENE